MGEYGGLDRATRRCFFPAHGNWYGPIERRLFVDMWASRSAASLKDEYPHRYEIPTRMFNSVRLSPESKVASARATMELRRDDLVRWIGRVERVLARTERRDALHQKRRLLAGYGCVLGPGSCGASNIS